MSCAKVPENLKTTSLSWPGFLETNGPTWPYSRLTGRMAHAVHQWVEEIHPACRSRAYERLASTLQTAPRPSLPILLDKRRRSIVAYKLSPGSCERRAWEPEGLPEVLKARRLWKSGFGRVPPARSPKKATERNEEKWCKPCLRLWRSSASSGPVLSRRSVAGVSPTAGRAEIG